VAAVRRQTSVAKTVAISGRVRGFTLLELMVVLVIVSLLAVAIGGSAGTFFSTMEYRDTVRELSSAAKKARLQARSQGKPIDLVVDPTLNRFALTDRPESLEAKDYQPLAAELSIGLVFAAEISPGANVGAIRFYPEGGSSGGEISIQRPSGAGTRLVVDWLIGDIQQEPL
jgi:general secretion pathway protein H